MTRDVFPRAHERYAMGVFLHVGHEKPTTTALDDSILQVVDGRLRLGHAFDVAWHAPDGSVQCKLSASFETHSSIRTINLLAELLGIPDRVERESTEVGQGSRFTYAGSYVDIDQVFTLAGPLTMKAWRSGYGADRV